MATGDIEAQVAAALAGLVSSTVEEDKKNTNPLVWIGEKVVERPDGGAFVNRDYMTKTDMQQKVLSQGAQRLPTYYNLANQLVQSQFMSESSAKYPGGVASGLSNAIDVYSAYASDGGTMNFTQWLDWYSGGSDESGTGTGGRGGGAGGVYTGPRTTTSVSITAKEDVERTLNTFAVDMLGRNLTDEELKKYTTEYRKQERGAPQVTTTTPQGPAATTSVTEQTVSRETIAQNILQDNPMFADNVIKTDVLDMFFNRLGGASSGS